MIKRSVCVTATGVWLLALVVAGPAAAADLTVFEDRPAAPALSLPDLDGKIHDLAAYRGRVVVVNFWATWCGPCIREFPAMQRARDALAKSGVVFLAVNSGQRRDIVARFARRMKITFPVLLDEGHAASRRWLVKALPVSYVVAPDGRVAFGVVGDHAWDAPQTIRRLATLAAKTD